MSDFITLPLGTIIDLFIPNDKVMFRKFFLTIALFVIPSITMFGTQDECERVVKNYEFHEYGMHKEVFYYRRNCSLRLMKLVHYNNKGERNTKKRFYYRRNGSLQMFTKADGHEVLMEVHYNRRGDAVYVRDYTLPLVMPDEDWF